MILVYALLTGIVGLLRRSALAPLAHRFGRVGRRLWVRAWRQTIGEADHWIGALLARKYTLDPSLCIRATGVLASLFVRPLSLLTRQHLLPIEIVLRLALIYHCCGIKNLALILQMALFGVENLDI